MRSRSVLLILLVVLPFGVLAGAAEPTPGKSQNPVKASPAWIADAGSSSCSAGESQGGLIPKPLFTDQHSLPPPCIATTQCANGNSISCTYTSYTQNCIDRPNCWIICDGQFQYCPDAGPECYS
jgi:hypothetical protein